MINTLDNDFDGHDYNRKRDHRRLSGQIKKVWNFMNDGEWHTLGQINQVTGAPEASASACLRDFRKAKWGSHTVEREYLVNGLYRYKLIPNIDAHGKIVDGHVDPIEPDDDLEAGDQYEMPFKPKGS